MSTAVAPPRHEITPEELLSMPDGKRFELVDGRLVERNMGWDSSWIAGRLHHILSTFCDSHGGGWVAPGDEKVRRPDVSFIRTDRLPAGDRPQGHCPIAPDLAVEVISPRDLYSRVEAKVDEYLGSAHGSYGLSILQRAQLASTAPTAPSLTFTRTENLTAKTSSPASAAACQTSSACLGRNDLEPVRMGSGAVSNDARRECVRF